MSIDIYINCPDDEEPAQRTIRGDLEWDLEQFFGEAMVTQGGCSGKDGFCLDFELRDGEDMESWVERLWAFLRERPWASRKMYFDVLPHDWAPGKPKRRVEVFGTDRWITDAPDEEAGI